MRPHSLTLQGFRSYFDAHTFEMTDRRLVGVVGPIGSGKSTILDAVAFALYGKTPTVERDTKSLINQRSDVGRVDLWFEVEGQHWRALRALRRSGQSEHALYRHAEPTEVSERLETVTGAAAVTAKVTELVGLDFSGFRRSVLLAQNQFAAFLKATPAERDDVLQGSFGFDRVGAMHEVAKARRDAAARDLEELERLRKDVEQDRAALELARPELAGAQESVAALSAVEPELRAATESVAAAATAEDKARERAAMLAQLAERLPDRDTSQRLIDAAAGAEKVEGAAAAAVAAAKQAVADAEAVVAKVAADGDRAALGAAKLALQRVADLDRARAAAVAAQTAAADALTRAEKALAAAEAGSAKADAARAAALEAQSESRAAVESAREEVHAAEHADMSGTLRSQLVAGEPCPVCAQPVAKKPTKAKGSGLPGARKALTAAERKAAAAEAQSAKAGQQAEAAAREAAAAAERVSSARDAVTKAGVEVADRTEEHGAAIAGLADLKGDPAEAVAAWEGRLDAADAERAAALQGERSAAADLDEARRAAAGVRQEMERLAREVATLAVRLGSDIDAAADPEGLATSLGALRDLWGQEVAAADEAQGAAAKAGAEAEDTRVKILARVGLGHDADFAAVMTAAREQVAAGVERVAQLETRVARFAALEDDNAAAVGRLATYEKLADDLTRSKFLNYLLDEERAGLAELGSERFELLSGGRYRFTPDFGVVDLFAADSVRRADSLSGGETFLASLALALALAEMVTREGGRLDAFFLDEGFGSLDAEHIDLAMEGIERLVAEAPNRLVMLVSHVPELRHRLEDMIVLDRDPVTGDTRVLPG